MTLEEVEARIKQISKLLYEDNPERQQKGLFSESSKEVKDAYELKLDAMEDELDALYKLKYQMQDASPEVGEKLVADFLNLYPMGKRGSAGIGSLLGKEIGGMSEAEALRIKDIEQKIYELNSVYQKEGRGLKAIEALEKEKQGIMSMLSKTPLSPKTQARNLISETPLSPETQARNLINETPTTGEVKPGTLIPSIKQELKTDLEIKKDYAEFFNPPIPIKGVKNVGIKENLGNFKMDLEEGKISASDAWENMSPPYTTEEINKLEKDEFKRAFRLAQEKWQETRSEYHKEAMRQLGVRAYGKGYLKGDEMFPDKGLKAGGYVMNYGDYGRSYT